MKIKHISARMILDSRGFPTVECDITLNSGIFGRASVPSGASCGANEALELRDNLPAFNGKGVKKAIENINDHLSSKLVGITFEDFASFDAKLIELDGTSNKSKFGANSILPLSLCFAKADAASKNIPFYKLFGPNNSIPKPMFNIINGGAHADNALDVQEFMVMPQFNDYSLNLQAACEVTYALKSLLKSKGYATNVGDEGGFAPALKGDIQALDLVIEAIELAGYKPNHQIKLCLDVAATEIYADNKYYFNGIGKTYDAAQLVDHYKNLCANYPIFSIEDGMAENDYNGWKLLTQSLGNKCQLVGDDLFVTNPKIFNDLSAQGLANAILIKPNQIGTLSETLSVIKKAKKSNYNTVISHRSGETEDVSIAHIAVGTNAGQIKAGAPVRTDRTAKYNELIRIAEGLKSL